MNGFFVRWSPRILSLLRIVAAFLFLAHGTSKLLGFPHTPGSGHELHLLSLAGFSGVLELVGGSLLLVGLFTRLVAFILSGEMAVAYFLVHAPHGLFPLVNKGELAALYSFLFLYFAVAGGGEWSLDRLLRRSS